MSDVQFVPVVGNVKARRHARNIQRSAKRRASADPCHAGTNTKVKDRGLRADMIQGRLAQQQRIDAKRAVRKRGGR
jgi:hypothetical protein